MKEQFSQQLLYVQQELARYPQARLVAASKQQNAEILAQAFLAGQKCFGENYLQEALTKIQLLQAYDIEWHFIGPIQSNKCKSIAEHFHWVQSVDRFKIAEKLAKFCPTGKVLQICVQVNIDNDENKSGLPIDEVFDFCKTIKKFPQLCLRGLMAIPQVSENSDEQRKSFAKLANCFKTLQTSFPELDTLSMGMSNDYQIALEEGSTMIRLGSKLFGERTKLKNEHAG